MVDAAEQAVARAGDVYAFGNVLVRATPDGVTPAPRASIRESLSRGARWLRGDKADFPPNEVVDGLIARPAWPSLRTLNGTTEVPILRPDGSVLDVPGYDASTGVLYHPRRAGPRVLDAPSPNDARRAIATLVDVVGQFPWEGPEHLTGWLAAACTPLVRNAYDGPAPLFLFDASTAGSGKSLLAKLAAVVGTGRMGAASPWPSEEEERRKAITAYALEGNRVVCWDNVTGRLGGKSLCIALTEPVWRDRVLGVSKQWCGRMGITFYATANNVELGPDMDRRVVHVRLAAHTERPERRTGWRYPDVLGFTLERQPELTTAALTVLRAYACACAGAGARVRIEPWGSYEGWARVVVEALVWAGCVDLGKGRDSLEESDPEREHMRTLVREWKVAFPEGARVRDAVDRIWPLRSFEHPLPGLEDSFAQLLRLRDGERASVVGMGNLLRRLRDRVFEGAGRLVGRRDRTNAIIWSVS